METQEQLAPEMPLDDEPRFLRRQKAGGLCRGKISQRVRLLLLSLMVIAAGALAVAAARFLLLSPTLALTSLDLVVVSGNHYVSADTVRRVFIADRGKSVLRVPLEARRLEVQQIPWVECAVVRRVLPRRIEVALTERTPVAFLREGSSMALVDSHGVVFPLPVQASFAFPVITGISSAMPLADRQSRMALFLDFLGAIERARLGASSLLSEVNLSEPDDLRAMLLPRAAPVGLPPEGQPPVLVHFGTGDYESKFRLFLDHIAQWEAAVPSGGIASVDLRFGQQVIVSPATLATENSAQAVPAAGPKTP